MLPRFADMASLLASAIKSGRLLRKCALAAIQTAGSVMPPASFASVFPVHGAIISASSGCLGPNVSVAVIVCKHALPQISEISRRSSSALPNLVSVEYAVSLRIGSTSLPDSTNRLI